MSDLEEEGGQKGVLIIAKDAALKPIHAAVSKPARRAYISTFLLAITAFILVCVAISAYGLLYWSYIPNRGFSRPIHLQFDQVTHGIVSLSKELVSNQPYDFKVSLTMPRTRENQDAGNFMVDLRLIAPDAAIDSQEGDDLAKARRSAILTYHSWPVEQVKKIVRLPWYILGWRQEAEVLRITMMEGVEFHKGRRNVPTIARLELQSRRELQVYGAKLEVKARFRGLRYIMHNWRITSFIVFTTIFWSCEMTAALIAWAILSYFIFPAHDDHPSIKTESTDSNAKAIKAEPNTDDEATMSDTSRTFPTYGRQPALHYSSSRIKQEDDDESVPVQLPLGVGEAADDEDESDDFVLDEAGVMTGTKEDDYRDSGIGTSLESSGGGTKSDSVRKRRSGGFGGGR